VSKNRLRDNSRLIFIFVVFIVIITLLLLALYVPGVLAASGSALGGMWLAFTVGVNDVLLSVPFIAENQMLFGACVGGVFVAFLALVLWPKIRHKESKTTVPLQTQPKTAPPQVIPEKKVTPVKTPEKTEDKAEEAT
jgi:lysylphosphatidylglycerol synthetase-like protein (DUF2156 family)